MHNFAEMASVVYTPTVGWACLNFSRMFRVARGMYFSAKDRGHMVSIAYNWPSHEVAYMSLLCFLQARVFWRGASDVPMPHGSYIVRLCRLVSKVFSIASGLPTARESLEVEFSVLRGGY